MSKKNFYYKLNRYKNTTVNTFNPLIPKRLYAHMFNI